MKYSKPLAAIVMTAVMSVSSFSVVASANSSNNNNNPIVVKDVGGADKKSFLDIEGRTADCKSKFHSGNGEIKSVTAVQTLEKKAANNYKSVAGGSCSKTASAKRFLLSNTVRNLSSGCYRLKTVFTIQYMNGKSEQVTVYSQEQTVK